MRLMWMWLGLMGCGGSGITADPPDTGGPPDWTPGSTGSNTGGSPTGTATPTNSSGAATGAGTPTATGTGAVTGTGKGTTTGTGTVSGTPTTTGITATGVPTSTGLGTTAPWSHGPTIDGDTADWLPSEQFPIDSGDAWITWDANHLYIAITHPDVGTGGPEHWLVLYLGDGGLSGSGTGVSFNTQQPDLAIPATRVFRWKADDSWNSWMTWDGVQWSDSPYWVGISTSELAESGDTVEIKIPFTAVGVGDVFSVHASWVFEGAGYESSYACSPDSSFVSGTYDPDHAASWIFDRSASDAPNSYAPSP